MEDKNSGISSPHSLVLENRRFLSVSGVTDVDSFDEQTVVAYTSQGELTVGGSNLHINRFSAEVGELAVEGEISSVSYSDNAPAQGGFFSRIFR